MTDLMSALDEARRLGFLGPAPLHDQIEHSDAFAALVGRLLASDHTPLGDSRQTVLDLGSGGGVPGLILARSMPQAEIILLEGSDRRAEWLASVLEVLAIDNAVVVAKRAETVGHSEHYRGNHTVVTSRSFGPPAVVAECAAPLLELGGHLVVSEPPPGPGSASGGIKTRWPEAALAEMGLGPALPQEVSRRHFVVMRQETVCPEQLPRRVGIPTKRPRF